MILWVKVKAENLPPVVSEVGVDDKVRTGEWAVLEVGRLAGQGEDISTRLAEARRLWLTLTSESRASHSRTSAPDIPA